MSPLMTTLVTNAQQILETPLLLAAAIAAFAVRPGKEAADPRAVVTKEQSRLSRHAMADIGFEPGAISWLPNDR